MNTTRVLMIPAALATLASLGACSAATRNTTVESTGEVAARDVSAVAPNDNSTIPIGATITASLDKSLGTKVSKVGDRFTATVDNTLYALDRSVVVPYGAKIEGHVSALDDSDNATEPAVIGLTFDRITFNGRTFPFSAAIVQANPTQAADNNGPNKTQQIVIGGAVGAAIGGLLGKGDLDKIVIGGAVGAAAGSMVSLGTEVNATLPQGSSMTLRATQTTRIR